ncbi:MAG: hypothetical protein U0487_03715 [Patescibacteria group bacterium]
MASKISSQAWLEVFIGIGVVAFLAIIVVPPLAVGHALSEIKRYRECQVSARKDCEPSMVWRLYDVALIQSGAIGLTNGAYQQEVQGLVGSGRAKTPLRTSDKAAIIEKTELVGLNPGTDGFYRPKGDQKITVKTTVTGNPGDVTLYLIPKGVETAGIPEKADTMKATGTGYEGMVLIPNGFVGELEIRATGPGVEQSQLYFDIAAE